MITLQKTIWHTDQYMLKVTKMRRQSCLLVSVMYSQQTLQALASARAGAENPDDWVVLPEIISKEPLGPLVRQGDQEWEDVVRWTLFAMINAEEMGITSRNVDDMLAAQSKEVKRLLGVEGYMGPMLGLGMKFGYNIIKLVGNYGESFNKHIGPGTPLNLERGLNNLWNNGGILYVPPFR